METEIMLRELQSVKSKEKDKQYHTFETDVYSMVSDVIPKIEKLLQYEKLEEQIGMPLEDFYACVTHNEESFFIIEINDDSEEFEIIEVFKEDGYMHNYSHEKFMFCGHAYDTNENYYEMGFGNYKKDMFLTYEEAEKQLEEMKDAN